MPIMGIIVYQQSKLVASPKVHSEEVGSPALPGDEKLPPQTKTRSPAKDSLVGMENGEERRVSRGAG